MGLHTAFTFRPAPPRRDREMPRPRRRGALPTWAAILCLLSSGCFLPPPAEEKPLTGELDDEFQVDSTVAAAVDSEPTAAAGDPDVEGAPGDVTVLPDEAVAGGSDELGAAADDVQGAVADAVPGDGSAASGEPVSVLSGAAEGGAGSAEPVASGAGSSAPVGAPAGSTTTGEVASANGSSGGDKAPDPDETPTTFVEVQESTATDLKPVGDAAETVAALPEGFDAQAMERDPDVDPPVGGVGEIVPKEIQSTVAEGQLGDQAATDRTGENVPSDEVDPGTEASGAATAPTEIAEAPGRGAPQFPVRQHTTDDQLVMTYEIGGPSGQVAASPESVAAEPSTVVFIHGWCGNRSQWRGHMEKFAADSIVLSVDLLGHGDSKVTSRDEWTIPRYGRDVAGVIEAEDLRGVVLVGHAMGGQVALEVALRLPGRIKGVIGVESLHELNVETEKPTDAAELEEYFAAFETDFTTAFREFVGAAAHPDTPQPIRDAIELDAAACNKPVAIKLMRHFQTRDLKSVVRNIECPVRCINSELFKTDVEGNRTLLTGFDAKEMANVGFWPHLESPESFQTELLLQIKEIVAPGKPPVPAAITGLNPVLFSDDVDALASFYVDRLEFKVTSRLPKDEDQPASLLILERDDWRLQLQSRASLATDIPGTEDLTRGGRLLFLTVTDLAAERRRLRDEVEMIFPFRTLGSSSQQTIFRDPEQNVIVLQQPLRRAVPVKD